MGFFTGRVTFLRFRVDGPAPALFGPEHLEKLASHAIGKQPVAEKDGTEVGWIAGDDILDLGFDLAKNVVNDTLHFCLRIDTQKLPADLLRSYARAELEALAAENPSGRPSAKQKKEAREAAREKLEAEAKDGRFIRRKAYPLLWDRPTNHLLVGTSSPSVLDRVQNLFQETFGCGLVLADAGQRAALGSHAAGLDGVRPASFVPSSPAQVAWVADPASVNYLGNEFLLWLWFVLETDSDAVSLADGSVVSVMLARTLVLDCPREVSGNETIRSDNPTKLPEARRAIQAGKLPRQAGMILVRHDAAVRTDAPGRDAGRQRGQVADHRGEGRPAAAGRAGRPGAAPDRDGGPALRRLLEAAVVGGLAPGVGADAAVVAAGRARNGYERSTPVLQRLLLQRHEREVEGSVNHASLNRGRNETTKEATALGAARETAEDQPWSWALPGTGRSSGSGSARCAPTETSWEERYEDWRRTATQAFLNYSMELEHAGHAGRQDRRRCGRTGGMVYRQGNATRWPGTMPVCGGEGVGDPAGLDRLIHAPLSIQPEPSFSGRDCYNLRGRGC